MIEVPTLIVGLALLAVPISWLLPRAVAMDGVAAWTALVLAILSPPTALWLVAATLLTPVWLRWADRSGWRDAAGGLWVVVLLAPFVATRLGSASHMIGSAYFTLRLLHVTGDWWMARRPVPAVRDHLRYQLFLPLILAGPIHRLDHFTRQCDRRRFSAAELLPGLERVLIGAVMVWPLIDMFNRLVNWTDVAAAVPGWFLKSWLASALDWVRLYFTFGGMAGMALGMVLMMGLRLEENFNRPWTARSMTDFWMRWHMTLSTWAMDYVFRPVSALARSPVVGLAAAMLAIGLWHEFSAYYVLWAGWQALGILLSRRAAAMLPADGVMARHGGLLGPVLVLAWLSAAKPVIMLLAGVTA